METSAISKEVKALQHNLASETIDINKLTRDELLQEIKQLEEELNQSEDPQIDIPEIIKHSYFDPNISSYFEQLHENAEEILAETNIPDLEVRENIVYENIFRMIGITAFPVTESSFTENQTLLGIRFDIFSISSATFKPPHYIILRKINLYSEKELEAVQETWSVYKHTLPNYVPLAEYQKSLDDSNQSIIQLGLSVHSCLIKIQYKHDKLDKLLEFKRSQFNLDGEDPIISNIERDLSCQRVLITFNRKNKLVLELKISNDIIEICKFQANVNSRLKLCECLLKDCKINDIIKKFRLVINTLVSNKIIE